MGLLTALRRRLVAPLDPRLDPCFYDEFADDPVVIYDIGAAGGVFTPFEDGPHAWAPVVAFEPHEQSHAHLLADGLPAHTTLHRLALSDADGPTILHAGEGGAATLSSLLSIDGLGHASRPVEVDALRLDSVPATLGVPAPNFLKLDTEGTEDRILAAGERSLTQDVLGILVEIAFWRHETSGARFADVDRFLTERGFVLFDLQMNRSDIRVMGGRKDKVRSGDALYLRNFESLPARDGEVRSQRSALLKLLSLAVAWRYLNYALELADFGRRHAIIDAPEFHAIVEPLVATVDLSDRVPDMPGRVALARLFDVLSYAMQPNMKKGVPHAFNGLGNRWVVRRAGRRPRQVYLHCPVLQSGTEARTKVVELDDASAPGRSR